MTSRTAADEHLGDSHSWFSSSSAGMDDKEGCAHSYEPSPVRRLCFLTLRTILNLALIELTCFVYLILQMALKRLQVLLANF